MSVGGRSLIRRTLEAFDRCPEITGITLLISQRNLLEVTRELESDGWRKAMRGRIVVEDDAELIEKLGKLVKVFSGSSRNLKVATREDAIMVEALLAADPLCV